MNATVMLVAALSFGAICLVLVSVQFFRLSLGLHIRIRMMASAHGVLLAMVLPYGLMVDALGLTDSSLALQIPLFVLPLLAVVSVACSCWVLRARWPYLALHLVAAAMFLPLLFWGSIAVVGWT